ncbi:MAG: hypothetical protein WC091_04095 [Sulfuricellaceae bacterium]
MSSIIAPYLKSLFSHEKYEIHKTDQLLAAVVQFTRQSGGANLAYFSETSRMALTFEALSKMENHNNMEKLVNTV